jgi:hypothetical protein
VGVDIRHPALSLLIRPSKDSCRNCATTPVDESENLELLPHIIDFAAAPPPDQFPTTINESQFILTEVNSQQPRFLKKSKNRICEF